MTDRLEDVYGRFSTELQGIRNAYERTDFGHTVTCTIWPYSPEIDGCVVSLWDAWNRFVRDLMLTSAAGVVRGASGVEYVPAVHRTEAECISFLVSEKRAQRGSYSLSYGKSGEPKWYQSKDAGDIATTLGLANVHIIASSLTASSVQLAPRIALPNPVATIQKCRNYIAHKSHENKNKMFQAVRPGVHSDMASLLCQKTRGGSTRFIDWTDALSAMANVATS